MPTYVDYHRVEGESTLISLKTEGEKTAGGAYSKYVVTIPGQQFELPFQDGPIPIVGHNGLTQEVLAAIIIHRLECFQSGDYPCEENKIALKYFQAGLEHLKRRTRDRIARGVEGANKP
jgi:hypothetical protein